MSPNPTSSIKELKARLDDLGLRVPGGGTELGVGCRWTLEMMRLQYDLTTYMLKVLIVKGDQTK